MKTIIANEKNLLKALKATAKAHNAEFENWLDEGQVGIKSETIPAVADIKTIVSAFTTNGNNNVEVGWGYTTIFVDCLEYKEELSANDIMQLEMSLPYGLKIKWLTK